MGCASKKALSLRTNGKKFETSSKTFPKSPWDPQKGFKQIIKALFLKGRNRFRLKGLHKGRVFLKLRTPLFKKRKMPLN